MPYKILLIEDETPAAADIAKLIEKRQELVLSDIAANGNKALQLLKKNNYDLILADINLPVLSGLEVVKQAKKQAFVIFITARKDMAVEGLNLGAVDYILKPVFPERFHRAVDRFLVFQGHSQKDIHTIRFFENKSPTVLECRRIYFIERNRNTTLIHSDIQVFTTNSYLKDLKSQLPQSFIQVHKKYIVNTSFISKKVHQGSGEYILILLDPDDTEIPIGRKFMKQVNDFFRSSK